MPPNQNLQVDNAHSRSRHLSCPSEGCNRWFTSTTGLQKHIRAKHPAASDDTDSESSATKLHTKAPISHEYTPICLTPSSPGNLYEDPVFSPRPSYPISPFLGFSNPIPSTQVSSAGDSVLRVPNSPLSSGSYSRDIQPHIFPNSRPPSPTHYSLTTSGSQFPVSDPDSESSLDDTYPSLQDFITMSVDDDGETSGKGSESESESSDYVPPPTSPRLPHPELDGAHSTKVFHPHLNGV